MTSSLLAPGADVHAEDVEGSAALHNAAFKGMCLLDGRIGSSKESSKGSGKHHPPRCTTRRLKVSVSYTYHRQ